MQITTDRAAYDLLQRRLAGIIAADVREMLHEAAASGASLDDAVAAITLGLATILDGSRMMEHEGRPLIPVLMFGQVDELDAVTEVLTGGGTSSLHEHVAEAARPAETPAGRPDGLPYIGDDDDIEREVSLV